MTGRILPILIVSALPAFFCAGEAIAAEPPVLESVKIVDSAVQVRLSKPASQRSRRLYDPNRLVIDIEGARLGNAPRTIDGKGKLIRKIRTGQFSMDPLTTRIVVDLSRDVEYDASYEEGAWVFRIKDPEPEPEEPAAAPPTPAQTSLTPVLEAVDVEPDKVMLRLSRPAMQRTSVTDDPPRIVIDFQGAELAKGPDSAPGKGRLLKEVRWGQYSRDPMVARVVLDLARKAEYSVDWEQGAWVVTLTPSAAATAAEALPDAAAQLPPEAPKPETASAKALSPVLESITVGDDEVALRLSQPSMQHTTVTEDPPRIIVDLQGTQLAEGADSLPGKGKLLKGVRWGQYSQEPLVARVVLDLKQLAYHQVSWDQGRWVVKLTGPAEPQAGASTPAETPVPAPPIAAPATKPAEAEAAVLDGVLVKKDAVVLKLSKPVSQKTSTAEEPSRVIVDLMGARLDKGADSLPGEGSLLSDVQWGQYSTDPLVARVILSLAKPASPKTEWVDGSWRVSLEGAAPAEETAKPPAPAEEAAASPAPADGVFTGVLKNADGIPFTGRYEVHLTLTDKATGDELWWEPRILDLKEGRYSVTLGEKNPLPSPDLPGRCVFGAEVMSERLDRAAGTMPFLVQVGVFGSEANAKTLKESLAMTYPGADYAKIAGRELFRVTVGPFASRGEAEAVVQRLGESGYKAILRKN